MAGLEKPEEVSEAPSARAFALCSAAHPAARAESANHAAGRAASVPPVHAALAAAAAGAIHAASADYLYRASHASRAAHAAASGQNESLALSNRRGRDVDRQSRRRKPRHEDQKRNRTPHDNLFAQTGAPSTKLNSKKLQGKSAEGCEGRHRFAGQGGLAR